MVRMQLHRYAIHAIVLLCTENRNEGKDLVLLLSSKEPEIRSWIDVIEMWNIREDEWRILFRVLE